MDIFYDTVGIIDGDIVMAEVPEHADAAGFQSFNVGFCRLIRDSEDGESGLVGLTELFQC